MAIVVTGKVQANTSSQVYEFNILKTTLGEALQTLAEQTKSPLLYPYEMAKRGSVNPVVGKFTVAEAIEIMLHDTIFSGGLTERGVLTISLKKQEKPQGQEEKVEVKDVKKRKKALLTSISALLFGISPLGSTYAQDASDSDAYQFEEIVVTGSNIRGAKVVGSAVQQIGPEAMLRSGRALAADYLRELPSNLAGGVGTSDAVQSGQDAGPGGNNISSGQGVNLRGLGALSTLILVNGRRMASSGTAGDFVDITNIPSAAIERMEILQDGASAVYGSDAVGGVVNFVLRREVEDPETTFRIGTATEGGGTEILASHIHGFNWDSGHAVIGGEYYSRDSVASTDRDRYAEGSDFTRFGGVNWPIYSLHVAPTANIYKGGTAGASAPVAATVPVGTNANLTNADLIFTDTGYGNTTNPFLGRDILPKAERYSIFASFDQELSEGVEIFGDARFTKRTADYDIGYSGLVRYTLTNQSPFFIDDIDPSLLNQSGEVSFGKVLTDRLEHNKATVKHFSGSVGARIDMFSDWRGEIIASYAEDKQNRYRTALRAEGDAYTDFMACALGSDSSACDGANAIPYNPFSTDPLTDAQLDQYYGFEDLDYSSSVAQFSVKADGTLFTLPGGDVKLAVGVDYRTEKMDGFLEYNTYSVDTRRSSYEATKRDAYSAFAELLVPVTKRLDVSLAGRYEEFSGTGSYNTFNPKAGFNFEPIDGFILRGSWGTSFHAPPMRFETAGAEPLGGNGAFLLNVSRYAPCDTELFDLNGIIGTPGVAGEECTFTLLVRSGAAGPGVLRPESSETWTLGFDLEPVALPGFRASVGYFNIRVDDRIQRIQSGTLNSALAELYATNGGGSFRSALTLNPSEAQVLEVMNSDIYEGTFGATGIQDAASDVVMIVNATQLNIAALKEKGFDFAVSYDFIVGDDTKMGVFAAGTYLTDYALQAAPGLDFVNQLGKYSSFGAPVQLRAKMGLWAEHGAFDGQVLVNYTDNYECDSCYVADTDGSPIVSPTPVPIDSWTTVDVALGWDLSDLGGMANGMRLNMQVTNLFNQEAPFLDGGTGVDDALPSAYDPNNHTIIGRTVNLTLTKRW